MPDRLSADLDAVQWVDTLLQQRRTTLPKRLTGPGPTAAQQQAILRAAASAPDHDQQLPWRFVEVPASARRALGQAFAAALQERDPRASPEELAQARDKALRSPWLLLAVVRTADNHPEVPALERVLSAGAAIQNMLLMATAMGLGSALTSGKALRSQALRRLFGLAAGEEGLCFVNIGHVASSRPPRQRPEVNAYFDVLTT
jgi:nitroreductase